MDEVRAILAVLVVEFLTVEFQAGVSIARRTARVLPQARLVEAKALRQIHGLAKLPLASDGRGVAGLPEQVAEGLLAWVEVTEARVIAHVVLAGHQLQSRRRAERLDVAALEADTPGGELVELGGLV